MTVAVALAVRTPSDQRALAVVTDSRLTCAPDRVLDLFVKAVELGPASIVVMAGDSTLPATIATEVSRPLIRSVAQRRASTQGHLSLLEEVRQFLVAYALVHDQLRRPKTATILAGWFADGSPGVIRIKTDRDGPLTIEGFRPEAGGAVALGVGEPRAVGLALDALRPGTRPVAHVQEAISRVAEVIWDECQDLTSPGVGGGLAVGHCVAPGAWIWPIVEVGPRLFFRGFPLDEVPPAWSAHRFPVDPGSGRRQTVDDTREPVRYPDVMGTRSFSATVWAP